MYFGINGIVETPRGNETPYGNEAPPEQSSVRILRSLPKCD